MLSAALLHVACLAEMHVVLGEQPWQYFIRISKTSLQFCVLQGLGRGGSHEKDLERF